MFGVNKRLLGLLASILAASTMTIADVDAKTRSGAGSGTQKKSSVSASQTRRNSGSAARMASSRHYGRHHRRSRKHVAAAPVVPQQVGVLVMTEGGETVVDQLSDVEFNPASVAKLVTAYGAIKTFGLNYQFPTKVLVDGAVDQQSGVLKGNLYVQGIDPDFVMQDALALQELIREAGIKKVDGKVFVSRWFSYASVSDANWSAHGLAHAWSRDKKNHVHSRGTAVGDAPETAQLLTEYRSESMKDTLKEMLSYSQNGVAEQIGRVSGGVAKLESIAAQEAGLTPGSLKLASASGLGKSRVKPKDMMLVLKALRQELQSNGLDFQDICPVAGVDGGTLDERFTDPVERGSVVGKTGSLPGTDGGTSTLVGMFRTQKENLYFVIFCWRGNVVSFRRQQDNMIRQIQSARGGARPFDYYKLSQSQPT